LEKKIKIYIKEAYAHPVVYAKLAEAIVLPPPVQTVLTPGGIALSPSRKSAASK
jgi:hypothetical protein